MNSSTPARVTNAPRHAPQVVDDSLLRVITITASGVILPGLNFFLAGKRRLGLTIMAFTLTVVAAAMTAVIIFDTQELLSFGVSSFSDSSTSLILLVILSILSIAAFTNVFVGYRVARMGHMNTGKRVTAFAVAVVLAALAATPAAYAGYYTYLLRNTISDIFVDKPEPVTQIEVEPDDNQSVETAVSPWEGKNRINVLLLGSDAGPGREGTRPDVIMVASINPNDGQITLFTLPRNLQRAPFPPGSSGAEVFPHGFNAEDRLLNSVWSWGEKNSHLFPGVEQPGLKATQEAVAGVLGLDIHYHASVDMEGFSEGVDALGGVRVNVPRDLPIGKTGEYTDQYVTAGENRLLNGYEALWYVRSRADSSDYDRMLRSRCMVSALAQSISPTTLTVKFPQLSQILRDHVVTNVPQEDLLSWAELVSKIDSSSIQSLAFTDDVIRPQSPDYNQIRAQVQEALTPVVPLAPEQVLPQTPEPSTDQSVTVEETEGPVQTVSSVC